MALPPEVLNFLRSSPRQTFLVLPAALLACEVLRRRRRPPVDARFLPLLAWGYLQYRLCGGYRRRLGGGGPGLRKPPERLVTTGPYALTRNPMYLGHLIFTAGLALSLRSPLGSLLLLERWLRLSRHVEADEARLDKIFGAEYRAYRRAVPRWLPRLR